MTTTIRLIGSGTRDNGAMSGFKGAIPWENLPEYREFILKLIRFKIVIVTLETFRSSFFYELMLEAQAQVIIVGKERIEKEKNVLKICPSYSNARTYVRTSGLEEAVILTGFNVSEEAFHKVSEVFFMRVDLIIGDGADHFPKLQNLKFHMVSAMPLRVEKPGTPQVGGRCHPSSVIPLEFQHWFLRKKKCTHVK